ncbi:MAG: endolytic transglycosylase MltG, partial [Ferruginibacter sp.]
YKNNVKPGRYLIKDGMSNYGLIKMLKSGNQSPVRLVINKLRLKEDLAAKIGKTFEIDSLEVINFLNNKDTLAAYKLNEDNLLSTIIPNSYEFNWNSSIKKIFSKLKAEEQKFWNFERTQKAKAKNLTPMQVYIIASIVEEETNKETDRPLVASVYTNRFLKGEKLQADPTVKFAMKNFTLNRILFEHLKFASPYNTYYTTGLPPGPICTPSSKTIDAVLNAPKTNYMFFVAKPNLEGYSNFAETYAEHQVFAKQYQVALVEFLKKKKLKEQQAQP